MLVSTGLIVSIVHSGRANMLGALLFQQRVADVLLTIWSESSCHRKSRIVFVGIKTPSSSDPCLDTATKVQPAAISFFPKSLTALLSLWPWDLCIVIAQQSRIGSCWRECLVPPFDHSNVMGGIGTQEDWSGDSVCLKPHNYCNGEARRVLVLSK